MRKNLFKIFLLLFSIGFCGSLSFAQENRQQTVVPEIWRGRAELLTHDLSINAIKISPVDRVWLYAQIGKIWRKADRERSREWFRKAVAALDAPPAKEADAEETRRLKLARELLPYVARDQESSDWLQALLVRTTEQIDEIYRADNAEAIAETALEILEADPKRAAQLAFASFRAGGDVLNYSLWQRLVEYDHNLAEPLLNEILAVARSTANADLLNSLGRVVYNLPSFRHEPRRMVSDECCSALLSPTAEALMRPRTGNGQRSGPCLLVPLGKKLVEEYSRLLPQQAATVRAALERCRFTQTESLIEDIVSDSPPMERELVVEEPTEADLENEKVRREAAHHIYLAYSGFHLALAYRG